MFKKALAVILAGTMLLSLVGCSNSSDSKSKKDELVVFNAKGENASEFEEMCKAFSEETGIATKAFSVGSGEDSDEVLRAQMNSDTPPAVYTLQALRALPEWKESGRVVDLKTIEDDEFKGIIDGIPETMRLNDGGSESYGIPYGIEGIGFIVDAQMISDLFGAESGEAVLEDLRNCPWEEFEAFCEAVDQYISTPTAAKVTLNGNEYSFQAEKTGRAASLTGVFAFAGAEKWVFADHLLNMPMGAVAKTPAEAQNVDTELIDEAKPAFMAYAEAIEFYTDHAAGLNGHAGRGADLVNSANFGYDQTVQMYADGNALFLQQGNWAYSNIAKVDEAVAERSSFIPLKMPFTDSMMLNGRSAEQLNSSIIVTTGNYYAINAKVSEKQQEYAVEFLKWMMKPENVEKYIVGEFKFIPYNVTEDMELDNALSASIQSYMGEGNVINDTVVGTPKTWSGEKVGTALLEKYLRQEEWDDSTIESIGELCVDSWKELKTN